jgi:aspartate/methionine/tyrosine aminotransferase
MVAVPEEAIFVLMNALLGPGDEAVVLLPAYQSLHEVARTTGCTVRTLDLVEDAGSWRLDLDRLASLLTPNTRLIVANFPHNPTGFLPAREQFEGIIALARRTGAYILGDEMYRDLEPDAARLPGMCDAYERGISLSGLSKSYGLPGLRLGWLATRDAALLDRCVQWKDYTTICNSAPSEILGIAALRARDRLLTRCRAIVERNTDAAAAFFARHQDCFRWLPPQAGPVAFPAWTGAGSVDDLCHCLLQERSVVIVPGSFFDGPSTHFRVGLGRLDFTEALGQLEAALESSPN